MIVQPQRTVRRYAGWEHPSDYESWLRNSVQMEQSQEFRTQVALKAFQHTAVRFDDRHDFVCTG